VAKLEEQLHQGAKSLVGNKGFRKYLRATGDALPSTGEGRRGGPLRRQVGAADQHRLGLGGRGIEVQRPLVGGIAVPQREVYSETRPIYHKCDDTIRGPRVLQLLALLLMKEITASPEKQGTRWSGAACWTTWKHWKELTVTTGGKTLWSAQRRVAMPQALQAAGVGLGPKIRRA